MRFLMVSTICCRYSMFSCIAAFILCFGINCIATYVVKIISFSQIFPNSKFILVAAYMFNYRTITSITCIHPSFKNITNIRILCVRDSRLHNPLISQSIMIKIWSVLLEEVLILI